MYLKKDINELTYTIYLIIIIIIIIISVVRDRDLMLIYMMIVLS
jgi:hypothetical protein